MSKRLAKIPELVARSVTMRDFNQVFEYFSKNTESPYSTNTSSQEKAG